MDTYELLELLSNSPGISGYEKGLEKDLVDAFKPLVDDIRIDDLGNIIAFKQGRKDGENKKIMLAAHIDEIGLMVNGIEDNGFLRFTSVGGIDPRTIIAQEVVVHGKKDFFGVIGSKPPHLQDSSESNKAIELKDMTIDLGMDKEEVNKYIRIGDPITIYRKFTRLKNDRVTGKALDDKAGVIALYQCAKELKNVNHDLDIYYVLTVQEEVGTRGAIVSTYNINPDIGIAVDVGFGSTPELANYQCQDLNKGPAITLGPNIHPSLRNHLLYIADDYNIPYQTEIDPGPTGTDGRSIQITRQGIPTLVLSIPLRYMHTSVEIISMEDTINCGRLLGLFINSISNENLEGLICY